MSLFRFAWILGGRRDPRTRTVLVLALAALVFGLALQSARACVSAWNPGDRSAQAAADSQVNDFDAGHCHHDANTTIDACFVHCEQDGQTARAISEANADDLRLAVVDTGSAYARWPVRRVAREPVAAVPRLDRPAYLLLHRLNR